MEQVNPFLLAVTQRLVQQANDFDPKIVPYAQAALNNSGKHLRPTLVALAGGAVGPTGEAHVTAAVIIAPVSSERLACAGRAARATPRKTASSRSASPIWGRR